MSTDRFSRLWRGLLAAGLLMAGVAWAQGQPEDAAQASLQQQRAELARARAQVVAEFAAREQACRERFFVNFCLRDVTGPRREALAMLRQQEVRIEEAERRKRQVDALVRIEQKREASPPAEPAPR